MRLIVYLKKPMQLGIANPLFRIDSSVDLVHRVDGYRRGFLKKKYFSNDSVLKGSTEKENG
jgi:hypothetical protein